MPATSDLTEDDVEAELEALEEASGPYPSLLVITEQAPEVPLDPQRIGRALPPTRDE